jgi:hypothetical protein
MDNNLDILVDDQARLIRWAADRIDTTFASDATAIGWGNAARIRAVTVYDRWAVSDCFAHIAGDGLPGWLSRRFLAAAFHYPFVQGGLRRITAPVSTDNERAIRLNQHFGFTIEGRLRHAGADGGDIFVFGMLREECRFLPRRYRAQVNQEKEAA